MSARRWVQQRQFHDVDELPGDIGRRRDRGQNQRYGKLVMDTMDVMDAG